MRYFFLFLSVVVMLVPTAALAQSGLVTCNGPDCTFCSVVAMINKVKDWIIMMTAVLAVLVLAYAGARMVVSQGNPSALSDAKQYLINVFIGVLLMLAAFTIVDSLMKVLVGGDFGPWNALDPANCGTQFDTPVPATSTNQSGTSSGQVNSDPGTTNTSGTGTGSTDTGTTNTPGTSATPRPTQQTNQTTVTGGGLTADGNTTYYLNDPAIPDQNIPAGPSDGNQITITAITSNGRVIATDVVTGQIHNLGCRSVRPVLSGCSY